MIHLHTLSKVHAYGFNMAICRTGVFLIHQTKDVHKCKARLN